MAHARSWLQPMQRTALDWDATHDLQFAACSTSNLKCRCCSSRTQYRQRRDVLCLAKRKSAPVSRWLRGPELERTRERDAFDPVVEGARHHLTRELALAIWERVCADATDRNGRCDLARAKRAFRELAARIAARGGRLGPEVGRSTQVETSSERGRSRARTYELATRAP